MKPNRIELNIINLDIDVFNDILIKFFLRERSSIYPICVDVDYVSVFNEDNGMTYYGEEDSETFRISLAPTDFFVDDWRVLAKIHQFTISSKLGVIILGEEDQVEEWEKVISITESIITKIQQFGSEIVSSVGVEVMPANLILDEEKSKKKNAPVKNKSTKSLIKKSDKLIKEFEKLGEETQDKYRRSYKIIEELENNYLGEYIEDATTKLKVSEKEIIVEIKQQMGWAISGRTVRRIKQFKDVILLNKTEEL